MHLAGTEEAPSSPYKVNTAVGSTTVLQKADSELAPAPAPAAGGLFGAAAPAEGQASQLKRTYTTHMMEEVLQMTKVDMDKAGHVFFPYRDDEPRDEALIEQEIKYLVDGLPKQNLSGAAFFVARDLVITQHHAVQY